jgi:hypothetical protein
MKKAANPISGNTQVFHVIFGFADFVEYTIKLLHLTINRRENAASPIICFVHFHRALAKKRLASESSEKRYMVSVCFCCF